MSKKLTPELIFTKINNNDPKNIRILNIWGNQISDISILSSFPSLEKINLNSNQIEDISALKNLTNIRELYLKENQIKDWNQIEYLKNNKKLEKLNLINNPICNSVNYFQKIIEILPQLKEIDNISTKNLKSKLNINNNNYNNNYNSPLKSNKENNNIISNNINNSSPEELSKNNLSSKSGSESVSSDRKGEARNDSAAPDPQANLLDDLDTNININQELNINNAFNALNKKNKEKEKIDLLNKSFKKKKTEGSFRKVIKKNIFNININNNNKEEEKEKEKVKHVINTDYNENHDKMSQTITSDFYKNPLKKYKDLILNEGGYKKKKVENLKKEHENKGSNIINQSNRNSVYKEYKFFDNDNEEEKKKSSFTPKKKKVFQKYNKLRPLITTSKKNETNNEEKNSINENLDNKINSEEKNKEKNKENEIKTLDKNEKNENIVNKNIVESIKLLASTLSIDGLKQIQKDVQKLLEEKSKN